MALNAAVAVKPEIEEILYQKGDVSLCLIINRRTRTMRVIDFRSGSHGAKRDVVLTLAEQEGLERIFTVVEREEASSWLRLGFQKEGNIPGFYKRSDAHLLGYHLEIDEGRESGVRLAARPESAVADRAERAYQAGRRMYRGHTDHDLGSVKVQPAKELDIARSLSGANRSGRALSQLEPFGRDGDHSAYVCTARGGFSVLVGVEAQRCFDNAYVQVLTAPRSDKETWLTAAALLQIGELLDKQGIVSAFSISLADSVEMTAALVAGGFRRTGRLPQHLLIDGARHDAFLWSRKLADPPND